jgi:zinc D-Ala-D-Ala dipeptidase
MALFCGKPNGPSTVQPSHRTMNHPRRLVSCLALLLTLCVACTAPGQLSIETTAPIDDPLLDVAAIDPRIVIDLPYASSNNFTGEVLYPTPRCLLRESVLTRLSCVQDDLEKRGYGLKIWDAYRPHSVQRRMWEIEPDARFVADPEKGSRHNRGMAVDVTLVQRGGSEVAMPTRYDDFTQAAEASYDGAGPVETFHRDLLIEAMERQGFKVLASEWWHFDAEGWEQASVLDVPLTP